jgi:hypothetical protein
MTITRLAFFKLLAAVGLTQLPSQDPAGTQCLVSNDGIELRFAPCSCGEGDERCPLGHCQKPTIVKVQQMTPMDSVAWRDAGTEQVKVDFPSGAFELHVCSACGIMYAPQGDKADK